MRWRPDPPTSSRPAVFEVPDLHICRGCNQSFVVPSAVLDITADKRYLMELQCKNCDLVVVSTHGEDMLEALDRELDRQVADMRTELEVWEVARWLEEIDAFALALQEDHVLPEDF
ncbi:MAG: hypothetical protein QOG68_2489 [Solirubrobacteraceae bacterium]|jgi:hypothetical protein|nr:hypothetical protein [Solirubrobacteraceae bacterium]